MMSMVGHSGINQHEKAARIREVVQIRLDIWHKHNESG
jgi:hypothetical protein